MKHDEISHTHSVSTLILNSQPELSIEFKGASRDLKHFLIHQDLAPAICQDVDQWRARTSISKVLQQNLSETLQCWQSVDYALSMLMKRERPCACLDATVARIDANVSNNQSRRHKIDWGKNWLQKWRTFYSSQNRIWEFRCVYVSRYDEAGIRIHPSSATCRPRSIQTQLPAHWQPQQALSSIESLEGIQSFEPAEGAMMDQHPCLRRRPSHILLGTDDD